MTEAILSLTLYSFLFLLLFIGYPYLCISSYIKDCSVSEKLIISLLSGSCYLITLAHIVFWLNIGHPLVIYFLLIATWALCQFLRKDINFIERVYDVLLRCNRLLARENSLKLLIGRTMAKLRRCICRGFAAITKHPIVLLLMIAVLFIHFYFFSYSALNLNGFVVSDNYIHFNWTVEFMQGNIYPQGIYPFGIQAMQGIFAALFQLDVWLVQVYFGVISQLLFLIAMYSVLDALFKSKKTILCFAFIMLATNFLATPFARIVWALPQELAWFALLPCGLFLHKFFVETQHRRRNLLLVAIAFALTISLHFYTAIIAIILMMCIALMHTKKIFNKKNFIALTLTALLSLSLSCWPFLIALPLGYEWHGSMNWAISMFQTAEETPELSSPTPDDELLQESVAPFSLENIEFEIANSVGPMGVFWGLTFGTLLLLLCKIIHTKFFAMRYLNRPDSKPATLDCPKKRKPIDERTKLQCGFFLYFLVLFLLFENVAFGLPQLMESHRMWGFLAHSLVILCLPLDMIFNLLESKRSIPYRAFTVLLSSVLIFIMGHTILVGNRLPSHYYGWQYHYNEVLTGISQIQEEYDDFSYTIVATTSEIDYIKDSGFHYELYSLIENMEDFSEDTVLEIPSEYIFFVVEKQPLAPYKWGTFPSFLEPPTSTISEDAAKMGADIFEEAKDIQPERINWYYYFADEEFSEYARTMLHSRLYYWLQEFSHYYPNELQLYYKEGAIEIYRFKQDLYALTSLAIPYGYNE